MTREHSCESCRYSARREDEEPCVRCKYNTVDRVGPDCWEAADDVNHPLHYCRDGAMECIDEMIAVFGAEAVRNYCLCNVWKYRFRALDKNGAEDMEKSDWYMRKYIELSEEIGNERR